MWDGGTLTPRANGLGTTTEAHWIVVAGSACAVKLERLPDASHGRIVERPPPYATSIYHS